MPTTIFWPEDVKDSGFCYGWTTPTICVAGVVQVNIKQDAIGALQVLSHSPQWKLLVGLCGSKPEILGTCQFDQRKGVREPLVRILDLSTPDYNIIYYYRHRSSSLRFYSLDILKLDSTNRPEIIKGSAYASSLKHDFTIPKRWQHISGLNAVVINQFNSAQALEDMLSHTQANPRRRIISGPTASICHILTSICNTPITLSSSSVLLKDISATIQQIDIRAEQGDFFITNAITLHHRSSTPISLHSVRYTNFFNNVWLLLNDIIIGFAFGTFLCENHLILSQILNQAVKRVLVDWVQWVLNWLDSWPAGLKLNTELSRFYSHTFIGLITVWRGLLLQGATYSPTLIYLVGTLSCGGVTLAISLFMDLLAILTFHIYICYVITRTVYQRVLETAGSLWNLFRGKRYNILRNRIDSWEYDIDQLLFGTILFTLLAFLFPTILVYYALFAMMRFSILILQAFMETLLALMNHFPLFALMLRVKDPWRLPGGIYFVVTKSPGSKYPLLTVKNQPVPLSSIFFQYAQLLSQLTMHYNPLRLLRLIFSGQYLGAIPRYSIRYNKIPRGTPS